MRLMWEPYLFCEKCNYISAELYFWWEIATHPRMKMCLWLFLGNMCCVRWCMSTRVERALTCVNTPSTPTIKQPGYFIGKLKWEGEGCQWAERPPMFLLFFFTASFSFFRFFSWNHIPTTVECVEYWRLLPLWAVAAFYLCWAVLVVFTNKGAVICLYMAWKISEF